MCQALALVIDMQVNKTEKLLLTWSSHPTLVTYNAQRMSEGDSYYREKQSREGVGISGQVAIQDRVVRDVLTWK